VIDVRLIGPSLERISRRKHRFRHGCRGTS
jgi:hypothetical protein